MKKFLALVLAFAVVCSFGITAFAGSPVAPISSPVYTTQYPDVPDASGLDVCKMVDDKVKVSVPTEEVILLSVGEAGALGDEDKAAFLAAYDAVKEIKDAVVVYFFWLDIPENYKTGVGIEDYIKLGFKCPGENVRVTVNGNEMEVVALEEANSYFAKLTETGAVAILCDAE